MNEQFQVEPLDKFSDDSGKISADTQSYLNSGWMKKATNLLHNKWALKGAVILAFLLLIASFVSFWFGQPSFSEASLTFTLDTPAQATAGEEITYKLTYANRARMDLHDLRLRFTYPDDSVVIKDGAIINELSEEIEIDRLSSGQSGELEFTAFLVGDRGNVKTARAELFFRAGDLRTQFERTTSVSTTITSLPIPLTLVAPPNVVPGQSINYILDYRNESSDDIADLLFEFSYPDGFSVQSSTPSSTGGDNAWEVPLLRKDVGGRINIQGTLSGQEGESKRVSVVVKRKISDQYVDYQKAEVTTRITSPLIGVNVTVNDATDYLAFPGDTLNYVVRYSNNSNFNLVGLNLGVRLDGQMYDFSTLEAGDGFFDSGTRTITWNPGSVSDFSNLAPNRSGEIRFRVRLKDDTSGVSGSSNLFVQSTATLGTSNVPSGVGGNEVSTQNGLVTKITVQPTYSQLIYYNDPAFGSFGPFPPQVDEETSFTIHWQLSNPGNEMSNARVSAVLPSGVEWENVTSVMAGQSDISFNPNTSEVVWNVGPLPMGVGIIGNRYEASFRIKIRPSSAQQGSTPTLIRNARLTATDSFTDQNIVLPLSDMTTDNLTDRPNEGTVQ